MKKLLKVTFYCLTKKLPNWIKIYNLFNLIKSWFKGGPMKSTAT